MDAFSKWCEAFPLKTMHTLEVARILYDEIICRYGAPSSILTEEQILFQRLLQNFVRSFKLPRLQLQVTTRKRTLLANV